MSHLSTQFGDRDHVTEKMCLFFLPVFSGEYIALDQALLMRVLPSFTHFTAEPSEAMRIQCLTRGHNMLTPLRIEAPWNPMERVALCLPAHFPDVLYRNHLTDC